MFFQVSDSILQSETSFWKSFRRSAIFHEISGSENVLAGVEYIREAQLAASGSWQSDEWWNNRLDRMLLCLYIYIYMFIMKTKWTETKWITQ